MAARDARASPQRIGLDLDPMTLVRDLSVAEQQMVEIARALSMKSRLIVMDEPTSALSLDRGREAVPHHPRPEGAGPQHHLRHPSARGGDARSATATRCCATAAWSAAATSPTPTSTASSGMMVGREVECAVRASRGGDAGRGRAARRGPDARAATPGPARHRARRRLARRCAAARSSASPAWSAPAAPRWRAPIFGADPFDSGRVMVDGEAVDDPLAARRHPPRHRPGAGGPQAAGAVPGARRPHQSQHGGARAHHAAGASSSTKQAERALVEEYPPGAQHPHGEPGADRRQSFRRQPAEGRARPLAGAPAEGADRRRADARHRRRRQGRGAQPALRDGARPASPSSRYRPNCRRSWRSATAS